MHQWFTSLRKGHGPGDNTNCYVAYLHVVSLQNCSLHVLRQGHETSRQVFRIDIRRADFINNPHLHETLELNLQRQLAIKKRQRKQKRCSEKKLLSRKRSLLRNQA
jgi:hypothetical protein